MRTLAWPGSRWVGLAESAEEFGTALRLYPDDPAAHVNRGVVVRRLGDKVQALEHFRRAVELNPNLAQARTNLGELLLELGRPQEALRHCQTALELEPELVEAHINLGNVLRTLGRLAEATRSYLEAMRLDPMRGQAAAGLGSDRPPAGRRDERAGLAPPGRRARAEVRRAAPIPGRSRGHPELYPEVQECCRRILEIDPDHPLAHNVLGFIAPRGGPARGGPAAV